MWHEHSLWLGITKWENAWTSHPKQHSTWSWPTDFVQTRLIIAIAQSVFIEENSFMILIMSKLIKFMLFSIGHLVGMVQYKRWALICKPTLVYSMTGFSWHVCLSVACRLRLTSWPVSIQTTAHLLTANIHSKTTHANPNTIDLMSSHDFVCVTYIGVSLTTTHTHWQYVDIWELLSLLIIAIKCHQLSWKTIHIKSYFHSAIVDAFDPSNKFYAIFSDNQYPTWSMLSQFS